MKTMSADETKAFANAFTKELMAGEGGAVVVLLEGDLGAGKTTFVQGVAEALSVTQSITSPTFVLEKVYRLTGQLFDQLVHIDAYRLEGEKASEALGLPELMKNEKTLILIEWPKHLDVELPATATRVTFSHCGGDCREITVAST